MKRILTIRSTLFLAIVLIAVAGFSLTATALDQRPTVNLNPSSLSFLCRPAYSCRKTTTLTNMGPVTLTISSITITGPYFSKSDNCPPTLAVNQFCTISVGFNPPLHSAGAYTGAVSVSDNGVGSPQQVTLKGTVKTGGSSAALRSLSTTKTASVPKPNGPSNVGTKVVQIVDPLRDDPFRGNGSKRELLVRFWYPASTSARCTAAEYVSPGAKNYFSELLAMSLPEITTNSCLDAPISEGVHPVIVFTHGYTGTFTDYTYLFEDLASRGYVVAAVDHTYEATAVEFPDGTLLKSVFGSHLNETSRLDEQSLSFAVSVRLNDLKFILDKLEELNAESAGPFAGSLDLNKVAVAGHSLGGLTALLSLKQEARFKAAVLLDATLLDRPAGITDTPVLLFTMGRAHWSDEECRLWSNLHGPRFAVNLIGAEHTTPSDAVWLAKGAIKTGAMGPEKTVAAIRDYIAAFLDAKLRGKPEDRLLAGPALDLPDAEVTTQSQSLCSGAIDH
jgi:dienelactone hydrolase